MMFYKETDFQESPVGKIPKEWEAKATEDLFIVETGTTPSTKQETYWKDGTVNWLTPTDLSKLNGKLRINGSERKITEKALKETNLTLMPKGSIILSTRAPVGYVATLEEDATFNQGCKGLIPRSPSEALTEFYSYYLSNKKKVLQNLSSGSTFLELSKSRLEKFSMPVPPISEQRGIVGVLGVVDSAIELADRVIVKTERLKKGLMQQLLTHGIGHTEYKDTPIGKIPETWEIARLSNVFKLASGKSRPSVISDKATSTAMYPVYGGNGILGYSSEFFLNRETIVIGRVGEYCGAVYKSDKRSWITDNALYATELSADFDIIFLKYLLDFTNLNKFQKKMGQPLITQTIVYGIDVPKPSLSEQRKIAGVLMTVDNKLKLETEERSRLEQIKLGLMDLLLTGKVRIKVD
ncbi:restriction endonuclease subunit S [Candidatus Bathyarchaeota archaeon]|nr:restriction endonuclease subunit S [Candidatus Bathyarchaeota archaeon]